MKKVTSTILLVLSLLFVVLSVAGTFYAIYDIDRISNDLAHNPSTSEIDFMGIGWGYGIVLFVLSAIGLILTRNIIGILSGLNIRIHIIS